MPRCKTDSVIGESWAAEEVSFSACIAVQTRDAPESEEWAHSIYVLVRIIGNILKLSNGDASRQRVHPSGHGDSRSD